MNTHPGFVADQIAQRGGTESARLLESLIQRFFQYGEERKPENLQSGMLLERVFAAAENGRANNTGLSPFNVIPSTGTPGACCSLCLAVALGGFGGASSARRPNFNQLSLELGAYWLRCQPVNRETLVLTPEWNQRIFDARFINLFEAYRETGRQAFIVEVARTGLILRWPY